MRHIDIKECLNARPSGIIFTVDLDVTYRDKKPWRYKVLKVYFDDTYIDEK